MTRVIMTNQYGEEVCELKKGMYGEYIMPEFEGFMVGDVLKIEEVFTDEDRWYAPRHW